MYLTKCPLSLYLPHFVRLNTTVILNDGQLLLRPVELTNKSRLGGSGRVGGAVLLTSCFYRKYKYTEANSTLLFIS